MKSLSANAMVGGLFVGTFVIAACIGSVWTPYDPMALDMKARLAGPSTQHLLGADEFGRDVLSRLMLGASASGIVSLATVAIATVLGTALGSISGYLGGWTDRVLAAVTNALLAFPGILLALGLLAIFGANKYGIVLALGIAYTPSVARIVRGTVLSLREREFIDASRISGDSEIYTLLRHILPNCIAPLTVLTTSMFGWTLLSESALSFLGLGVPPPAPTWGNMLAAARPYLAQAAWLAIFPGLCISIVLLGINLLGDALRDRLDPKMRGMQ
ncbi:ABC transporter permease [Ensifer sp. ENS10]|uniref:ABC transporter permease n=1 Tax=Ensifer sp. ENS10 TaxID=2769286 RepID=UPI0017804AC6|nr:ABC transporter permease [Ensifer sp. ENS10]MBD9508794.1 ABC transporter permease [Ensifer sp. ENS10]